VDDDDDDECWMMMVNIFFVMQSLINRVFREEDGEASDANMVSDSQVAPSSLGHNPFLDVCMPLCFLLLLVQFD